MQEQRIMLLLQPFSLNPWLPRSLCHQLPKLLARKRSVHLNLTIFCLSKNVPSRLILRDKFTFLCKIYLYLLEFFFLISKKRYIENTTICMNSTKQSRSTKREKEKQKTNYEKNKELINEGMESQDVSLQVGEQSKQ